MIEARESSEVLFCILTGENQVYEDTLAANRIISNSYLLSQESPCVAQYAREREKLYWESENSRILELNCISPELLHCKV